MFHTFYIIFAKNAALIMKRMEFINQYHYAF